MVRTTNSASLELVMSPPCWSGVGRGRGSRSRSARPSCGPGDTPSGSAMTRGRFVRIAERRDHERRAREVLVGRVAADGHERAEAGRDGGLHPVPAVLDDHRLVGAGAELVEGEQVDVGRRLLVRHDVAGEDGEPRRQRLADRVLEHGTHGCLGRRRGDGEPPARGIRFAGDARDTGPCGQGAAIRPGRCRWRSCADATGRGAPAAPPRRRAARSRRRTPGSAGSPCAPCRPR